MTLPASIAIFIRRVGAALTSRRAIAAAPVIAVSLVVGVAMASSRTDPARVETREESRPPVRRLVSTSQGVGDVVEAKEKAKTKATAKEKAKTKAKAKEKKQEKAEELAQAAQPTTTDAATPLTTGAPTTQAPTPEVTAPDPSSSLIGPVPPEPWPAGSGAPLTGMGIDSPYGAGGPAVAVKVSNAPQADPQTGLNRADLIYEEPSHDIGSVSRFLAIFHSRDVNTIGAVRSARTSDPPLLAPLGRPILAFAGANTGVHQIVDLRESNGWLVQAHENRNGGSFFRLDGRRDEHSLFVNRNSLVDSLGGRAAPPNPQFSWLPNGAQNAGAQPASRVDLQVAGTKSGFIWDDKSQMWLRFQSGKPHVNAGNGAQIGRSSVIILTTNYVESFADRRSLEALTWPLPPNTIERGQAWVLTGNTVTQGTWSRGSELETFNLKDLSGRPMGLQRGPVYVGLVSSIPSFS